MDTKRATTKAGLHVSRETVLLTEGTSEMTRAVTLVLDLIPTAENPPSRSLWISSSSPSAFLTSSTWYPASLSILTAVALMFSRRRSLTGSCLMGKGASAFPA